MKVYQCKYNEILIAEGHLNEELLIDAYNDLFDEILSAREISSKKVCQVLNINNNSFASAPFITKELLLKKTLPAFKFLIFKN